MGDARVCCQANCVWNTNQPVGGSSCPLRTPFKHRGDLSGTHLPRCSQRSPAFLRGDSGGGVERGRGRREKTLILRSRPPPTLGATPRLGCTQPPAKGRAWGIGPAARGVPNTCQPHLASRRPHLATAPRRGRGDCGEGRAGLNPGGSGRWPWSERRHCASDVERAGGTWEAGLPPRETETPARRSARGRRGWGGKAGAGAVRPRGVRGSEL